MKMNIFRLKLGGQIQNIISIINNTDVCKFLKNSVDLRRKLRNEVEHQV